MILLLIISFMFTITNTSNNNCNTNLFHTLIICRTLTKVNISLTFASFNTFIVFISATYRVVQNILFLCLTVLYPLDTNQQLCTNFHSSLARYAYFLARYQINLISCEKYCIICERDVNYITDWS